MQNNTTQNIEKYNFLGTASALDPVADTTGSQLLSWRRILAGGPVRL